LSPSFSFLIEASLSFLQPYWLFFRGEPFPFFLPTPCGVGFFFSLSGIRSTMGFTTFMFSVFSLLGVTKSLCHPSFIALHYSCSAVQDDIPFPPFPFSHSDRTGTARLIFFALPPLDIFFFEQKLCRFKSFSLWMAFFFLSPITFFRLRVIFS